MFVNENCQSINACLDIMSEVFICLPNKRNQQPNIFAFKKQYLLDLTENNDSFVDFLREGAILSGG